MTWPLHGRTVLITGPARGIGEHVARQAAAKGARLALIGMEQQRLARLAASLDGADPRTPRHVWHECDVTDRTAVRAAVGAAAQATGRIDVVVANAGVANLGTVAVTDVEALVRTIDVNLNGVVRTVAATLPYVRAARGYYLLISSVAAFAGLPGMAAYSAAKAGVEQFGNVLRLETAHLGIRVGIAHPMWIDTDMVRDIHRELPSARAAVAGLPWPLARVVPVQRCAAALVRALERRSRRVYVPRHLAALAAARTLLTSVVVEFAIRRFGHRHLETMEREVLALGRWFGSTSVGLKSTMEEDRAT